MREILFRGKRLDNGEWAEGFFVVCDQRYFIVPTDKIETWNFDWLKKSEYVYGRFIEVIPATVGQYTGLTDKNYNKIFEGDIVEGLDYNEEDGFGVVEWDDGAFFVGNGSWCGTFCENYYGTDFEVIGNIHDNPELIGGADNG